MQAYPTPPPNQISDARLTVGYVLLGVAVLSLIILPLSIVLTTAASATVAVTPRLRNIALALGAAVIVLLCLAFYLSYVLHYAPVGVTIVLVSSPLLALGWVLARGHALRISVIATGCAMAAAVVIGMILIGIW